MFRDPLDLIWMMLVVLACWFFISRGRSRRKQIALTFGKLPTLNLLLKPETSDRRKIRFLLQTSAIALLFLALAGPQWGVELSSSSSPAQVVLIAVDTSLSMLTEDVSPNRLEKLKNELDLILSSLKTLPTPARVGIIAFSGQAALVCPLTTDSGAVGQVLSDIQAGMIPTPGTSLGNAIELATQTLAHYAGNKNLIILSDGGDHGLDPVEAAEEAAAHGIRIFTVGLGTPDGGPIPIKDAAGSLIRYVKDKKGATVIAHLREKTLQEVAAKTAGDYWRASASQDEISALLREIIRGPKAKGTKEVAHSYKNHFLIPLALAFLLLLIELLIPERIGALDQVVTLSKNIASKARSAKKTTVQGAFFIGLFLALGISRAQAAGMEGNLRSGNKLYTNKQYAPALNDYLSAAKAAPQDPRPIFNAGDALYRLGQYQPASKAFSQALKMKIPQGPRSISYYNLGNSAFEESQYAEAAEAYRQSLLINPNDPAGAHNLAVAMHYLQHPPPKKKNQKNNPQKKNGGGGTPPPNPSPSSSQQKQRDPNQSKNQLSKDDVKRILSSVTDKKPTDQKQAQQARQGKAPNGEDW